MNKKFKILTMIAGFSMLASISTLTSHVFADTEVNHIIAPTATLDFNTYTENFNATLNENELLLAKEGWVKFENVDFGGGLEHFDINVSTEIENEPSSIRVFLDNMNGIEIAATSVEMLPGQTVDYRVMGADLDNSVSGIHDIYIKSDDPVKINWAKFTNIVEHKVNGLTGSSLTFSLQKTIDSMKPYDVLQLDNQTYEMSNGSLKILKPMTIRGSQPKNENYKNLVGASDLTTILNDIGTITVQTNDVKVEHLEIIKDNHTGIIFSVRVDGYPNTASDKIYEGFVLNNVKLLASKYSVHTGNGAEVTFTNCTFEDFNHHALTLDRRVPTEVNPQLYIDHCFFSPHVYLKSEDSVTRQQYRTTDYFVPYNLTAIVIDGGNDEYIIWDLSNSVFSNNELHNTAFSFAKVANVHIHNNKFIQDFGDVEMIHMEEFTNNILIEHNLFESTTVGDRYTSMGIGIDREMQSTFDIIFRDNTITGGYARFFNAYAPQGILIENNDFTGAFSQSIQTPNGLISDTFFYFTWNALEHHLDNMPDVGAKNVIIRNNKFDPSRMDRYKMTIEEYEGETTNYFQPELIIDKTILTAEPEPYIPVNQNYRILNKATNEYLYVKEGDEKIYYSSDILEDGSDIWHLGLEQSIYYTLKNEKEDKYLEVKLPFTAAHMDNNSKPAEVHAKILSDYSFSEFLPMWFFVEEKIDGVPYMLIHPGYSECRSRLTRESGTDHAITEVARIASPASYKPFEDEDLWEFIPVDGPRFARHSDIASAEIKLDSFSFEAGDFANYKIFGSKASAYIVNDEGVTHGNQALEINMLERQDDPSNAATLILTPENHKPWNLGIDKTMYMSLTNPNSKRMQIRVSLTDRYDNLRTLYFWLEPNSTLDTEIGPDLLGEIGVDETKYAGTHGHFGPGVDPTCIVAIKINFPENNPALVGELNSAKFIVDNIHGFVE
ncbi:MAG: hypothetical protein ATN31_07440 [Candidatus Epulonipiscioides saccharophilum]|nr:MAG: hypothetical protein ATN31_07440 [Epulopiscium sp. AS2M-Bin001]